MHVSSATDPDGERSRDHAATSKPPSHPIAGTDGHTTTFSAGSRKFPIPNPASRIPRIPSLPIDFLVWRMTKNLHSRCFPFSGTQNIRPPPRTTTPGHDARSYKPMRPPSRSPPHQPLFYTHESSDGKREACHAGVGES